MYFFKYKINNHNLFTRILFCDHKRSLSRRWFMNEMKILKAKALFTFTKFKIDFLIICLNKL